MIFTLRCQECRQSSHHRPEEFYSSWAENFEVIKKDHKHVVVGRATFALTLDCQQCGNTSRFDTPMYSYAFKVIFDEFSK